MVDYYLQQFLIDIDQVVRGSYNKENLLVEFYKSIFQAFKAHSASARVFFLMRKSFCQKKELFHKKNGL